MTGDRRHPRLRAGRNFRRFNVLDDYHRTVRYDWLGQYPFDSIEEVQDFATRWLWTCHHERLNTALGGSTKQAIVPETGAHGYTVACQPPFRWSGSRISVGCARKGDYPNRKDRY